AVGRMDARRFMVFARADYAHKYVRRLRLPAPTGPGHKKAAGVPRGWVWLTEAGLTRPRRRRLHQALGGIVVMFLHAVLVTHHLTVELVDQLIHRGVKILVGALGKQVVALDVDIAFGPLSSFLFLLLLNR